MRQLNSVDKDFYGISEYLTSNESRLSIPQHYYIKSIVNREKYYLKYSLKQLFPSVLINGEHISNIIRRYCDKDLNAIKVDLQHAIQQSSSYLAQIKLDADVETNSLKSIISQNSKTLYRYYAERFGYSEQKAFPKHFKIALTFSGESRAYVEKVAILLTKEFGEGTVFYDKFYQSELARLNLDLFLQNIYHNIADFIVIFLSRDYENREWCGIEWRAMRDLIKKKYDRIILVKLGDFALEGIFSIDGYIDGANISEDVVSEMIIRRVST